MATFDPFDVIEVIAKFSQAGQQIRNVYQLIHTGQSTAVIAGLPAAIASWMESAYAYARGEQANDLSYDSIEINNITRGEPLDEDVWPTYTAGTNTGQPSPLQIAYVVRFPTNYQGSQGRKFLAGVHENALEDNGVLTTTTQANLLSFGATIVAGPSGVAADFVVGADNPTLLRFAQFTGAIVNDIVGTQRRRRQGQGI